MYKSRFFLLILLSTVSSCSTVDAIFGPEEPELAVPTSKETLASENQQLETEISALRNSLKQLKTDIANKQALKAQELARLKTEQDAAAKLIPTDRLWVTVSFRSGHIELTNDSSKALKRLAAKFLSKERQQTIEVRGYTDDEPIGGYSYSRHTPRHPFKSNLALSKARADSVANALIAAGLPSTTVQAKGYGANDFAADNKSEAGRQKNRRSEIHLISR